jgi:hypothetical protein
VDGRYRFADVPPGGYYIVAGHTEPPTYYPGVKGQSKARVILAPAGGALADVDFALARWPSVSGRVIGIPSSLSSSLVRVVMNRVDGKLTSAEAVIGADGSFEFTDVTPGDYSLFVVAPVFKMTERAIHVLDTDIRGLELIPPILVSGHVIVEGGMPLPAQVETPPGAPGPLTGLRLDVRPAETSQGAGPQPQSAAVHADGAFRFDVEPGSYTVGMDHLPLGYYVKSITAGGVDVLREPLVLKTNVVPPELSVTLTTTPPSNASRELNSDETEPMFLSSVGVDPLLLITTIPGYRANPMGHEYAICVECPLAGKVTGQVPLPAKIQLILVRPSESMRPSSSDFEAAIDSTGQFSFPRVPPGVYSFRIPSPSLVPLPLPRLWVLSANGLDNMKIQLPAIREISGRIVVEGGRPAPDEVRVNIQGGVVVAPQRDGQFTLPLAEGGQYALFLTGLPQGYAVRSIRQAGRDLQREALKVEEDADPAEIVVTLTRVNGVQ